MERDPGIWLRDPETGEDVLVHYSELESDVREHLFFKPVGGFVFAADLFTLRPLPETPFYIQGWLPKQGKALIYAPPKTGKSYLAMQIARCIGAGEPFLGMTTAEGQVLYIQFELGEAILQHRLRDETKKEYPNVYVGTSFSLKLDQTYGKKLLWDALLAVEPQVLILDPFYKAIVGDENETADVLGIVNFLDELIETCRCSIILIHHSGKDESRRGRGSSVLEDWVDSYVQMKRVSHPGEQLKVKLNPVFLRHAALPPEPIEAVFGDDFEFHLADQAPTVRELVVTEFKFSNGAVVTPKDLFAAQIGTNSAVYKALNELASEGLIVKLERGKYQWNKPEKPIEGGR